MWGWLPCFVPPAFWLGKMDSTPSISLENHFVIFVFVWESISSNHSTELREYLFTHPVLIHPVFTFLGLDFVSCSVDPVLFSSNIRALRLKIAKMIASSSLLLCVFWIWLLMTDFWALMSMKSYDFSQVEIMHWCVTLMFSISLNLLDCEIHEYLKHFEIFKTCFF